MGNRGLCNLLFVVSAPLLGGSALAGDEAGGEQAGVHGVRGDEEVVVYGDLFARWDGTRWSVATEVHLPIATMWRADQNWDMRVQAYQIRTVLACDKDWKLSGRKYEVSCRLEEVGLQAVVNEAADFSHVDEILQEMDAKLSGARVQLQVRDNGRVTNIDLEDVPPPRNRRERAVNEAIRQVLTRVAIGFDMKLRKANFLSTGQWVENRSSLLSMPSTTLTPASGLVVHQLNGYRGHIVVQTKGEGQIMTVDSNNGDEITYFSRLNGVSIYDDDGGYMTERVWSMNAEQTAGSFQQFGMTPGLYAHSGVLRLLGDEERVDVGPTREVRPAGEKGRVTNLAEWTPVRPN